MKKTGECTVVLLDRQPLWLNALEQLLSQGGIDVLATSTDPDEAIALVAERMPDVLVAELDRLDQATTFESIRRAQSVHPGLRPVVLSTSDDPALIDAAFEAGACVYCVKTAASDDLLSAIRQALNHSIYVADPSRRQRAASQPETRRVEAGALTKREIEILQLVAEGHSNLQLAQMLWVTEQTVKFHLSNIYRKLQVANRTEASRWAQVHGLLPTAPAPSLTAA
jgi:DNA-binding NarL/FixJ family response regulator